MKDQGIVWLPYVTKNVSTSINGEVVWHSNKWKNFLLKMKRLFVKPKYLKNGEIYSKKTIDPSYYQQIEINKNTEQQ